MQAQDVSPPTPKHKQQVQAANAAAAAQTRRRLSNDPRTCDECGRSFKYPSDLKKHLQIHTGKYIAALFFHLKYGITFPASQKMSVETNDFSFLVQAEGVWMCTVFHVLI